MLVTVKNYIKSKIATPVTEKGVIEAYNLWAPRHDMQPGNLMLHLNDNIFEGLLQGQELKGKHIADIGCGTGRQWPAILNKQPVTLTGFDVSAGMLKKLKQKYPQGRAHKIGDNLFSDVADASFDMIVSTLTVAHIEDINEAMHAWCRLLKPSSEIIITDFHPHTLTLGGKRTFKHGKTLIAVRNYVHPIYTIKDTLLSNGFKLVAQQEIKIDETMKPFYANANALHIYEKYLGFPVIYGIHLKRDE